MELIYQAFSDIRLSLPWQNIFAALVLVVMSQLLLFALQKIFDQFFEEKLDFNKLQNSRKLTLYIYNFIVLILVLKILTINMKVILGAAGFLTLAIGFAARIPISNLISGIFLLFERPFGIGSIIEVDGHKGEIVARNLLSVTLRTLDNLMVRVPNEVVVGSAVSNFSHFPIRRFAMNYLVSQKESLTRLEGVFMTVASRNRYALDEPEPYFRVTDFKENSIQVLFQVWCTSEDYREFQAKFPKEIHRALRAAGLDPIQQKIEVIKSQNSNRETNS